MVDKNNSLVEASDDLKQNLEKLDVLTKRFVAVVQSQAPGIYGDPAGAWPGFGNDNNRCLLAKYD